MLRLSTGILALLLVNAWTVTAIAQTGPRVHSLVIVASDDFLPNAQKSGDHLKRMLDSANGRNPAVFKPVQVLGLRDGRQLTAQAVKATVERVFSSMNDFKPDDTIFCYVFTHGGHSKDSRLDPEMYEHGHFLQLNENLRIGNSYFARCDLFETLLDQRQKVANSSNYSDRLRGLTVLISDSCNNAVEITAEAAAPAAVPPSFVLLETLLTKYQGQISVNSSSMNELAWYSDSFGGRFSFSLIENMKNAPATTTWVALVDMARQNLADDFPATGKRGPDNKLYRSQTPMWMRDPSRVRRVGP